jgi:predicted RNA-binding Zn ribbon-like protein
MPTLQELVGENPEFDLDAGVLCLDFANTVDWHASDHPEDALHAYKDLVAWGVLAGALTLEEARPLIERAARDPGRAAAALERAIAFREAMYRIFSAHARERALAPQDIEVVNREVAQAQARLRLVPSARRFDWGWAGEGELERVLWPVARSAAEVMTSPDFERVGECADDRGCGWLFMDRSRNHSRRWCSMDGCGNRAKVRRHYQRDRVPEDPR